MDIYKRRTNLKLVLLVIAVGIGLFTTIYTNYLTNKIAKEEKRKAQLWAAAITSKAHLVRYTNELFERLASDERKKVNVWSQATKLLTDPNIDNGDELNFFSQIITGNTDIPVILADENGKLVEFRNFQIKGEKSQLNIADGQFDAFRIYRPISISFESKKNFIYYRDSNLFRELKKTLNDIISSFITEVVINTASAPVIMTDPAERVIAFGNIDSAEIKKPERVTELLAGMRRVHEPIEVDLGDGGKKLIYYDDSTVLKQLKVFPYIQLGIFSLFLVFSYFAFSSSRHAEQNMVWVGMAKETAHQLGTPISSLGAWIEYLKENDPSLANNSTLGEMELDVERLTLVADRFSKIGSVPQLKDENVKETLQRNIDYMKRRSSKDVQFGLDCPDDHLTFAINTQLFDWVLENLYKNALDAMQGAGSITTVVSANTSRVFLDITDSGCGIPRNNQKTIFEPGFSTKRRGWGLGLSLTKRIVESYHSGKIYVKHSEVGKGTTFRIEIPRNTS
jgi:two-component system, sporulation sensor kinase D